MRKQWIPGVPFLETLGYEASVDSVDSVFIALDFTTAISAVTYQHACSKSTLSTQVNHCQHRTPQPTLSTTVNTGQPLSTQPTLSTQANSGWVADY